METTSRGQFNETLEKPVILANHILAKTPGSKERFFGLLRSIASLKLNGNESGIAGFVPEKAVMAYQYAAAESQLEKFN